MEAEALELARQAVAGLQAANSPSWTDVAGVIVTGMVGVAQCGLIGWGLRQIGKASDDRNRQLDAMEARQEAQGQALAQIGQALDRQGQALEQQG